MTSWRQLRGRRPVGYVPSAADVGEMAGNQSNQPFVGQRETDCVRSERDSIWMRQGVAGSERAVKQSENDTWMTPWRGGLATWCVSSELTAAGDKRSTRMRGDGTGFAERAGDEGGSAGILEPGYVRL